MSVIVVNWNTRELLEPCLRSIQAQAAELRLEVILVDNGSTDGSVEFVQHSFSDLQLIVNSINRGYSAANNQGIGVSRGRYVLLLNSDTTLAKGALRALANYGDAHPEVGVMGPQLLNPDGTLQPSGGVFPTPGSTIAELLGLHRLTGRPRYGTRRDYSLAAQVDEVSGAAMVIARPVLDGLGGLDENFPLGYEDVDFCLRARRAGWQVHYVPAARVFHEWGASRRLAPASTTLKAIAGRQHYFHKHYGEFQSTAVIVVTVLSHLLRMILFAAGGLLNPALHRRAQTEWVIVWALVFRPA